MKLHRRLPEMYHWALPPHIRRYLNDRGVSDAMITRFQVGWNGERVTIPVYDRHARVAFFKLGKSPEDRTDSPKMLYCPASASAELYGWETIRARPANERAQRQAA